MSSSSTSLSNTGETYSFKALGETYTFKRPSWGWVSTVWKFQDFSVIQILREIKFRSTKTAVDVVNFSLQ